MKYLNKFIRRFFLIREIISGEGKVHFRRYRILETPWFSLYIHNILESDLDLHMHDHPWDFVSVMLSGGYLEYTEKNPEGNYFLPIDFNTWDIPSLYINAHVAEDLHKIKLIDGKPVWSIFLCGPRRREFGYGVNGKWIHNKEYREFKNTGRL
jgi:hypothetical protein